MLFSRGFKEKAFAKSDPDIGEAACPGAQSL
jgi:hypothetical protein